MADINEEVKQLLVAYKPLRLTLMRFSSGLGDRLGYSQSLSKQVQTTRALYDELFWEIENELVKYCKKNNQPFPTIFYNDEYNDNYVWQNLWEHQKQKHKDKFYEFNNNEKLFLTNLKNEVYSKIDTFVTPTFYSKSSSQALSKFKKHFDKLFYNIEQHNKTAFLKSVGMYTADNEVHGFA